jgi:putative hydrolase of the HAD superfamily
MVRAVLFDLDDTLFDHRGCARTALERLHAAHACFRAATFEQFERCHAELLEELHREVLAGRRRLDDARRERFRRLFERSGVTPDDELVHGAAMEYRRGYLAARQAIAGAAALLPLVRARARVGVVSNNLLEEQREKIRHCELEPHVDVLVVSEEAGVSKPDPRIFHLALERLGCAAGDAVMIGDSWSADIAGARAAGIRPVWFNPLGLPAPAGGEQVPQLRSLVPASRVLDAVFGAGGEAAVEQHADRR